MGAALSTFCALRKKKLIQDFEILRKNQLNTKKWTQGKTVKIASNNDSSKKRQRQSDVNDDDDVDDFSFLDRKISAPKNRIFLFRIAFLK